MEKEIFDGRRAIISLKLQLVSKNLSGNREIQLMHEDLKTAARLLAIPLFGKILAKSKIESIIMYSNIALYHVQLKLAQIQKNTERRLKGSIAKPTKQDEDTDDEDDVALAGYKSDEILVLLNFLGQSGRPNKSDLRRGVNKFRGNQSRGPLKKIDNLVEYKLIKLVETFPEKRYELTNLGKRVLDYILTNFQSIDKIEDLFHAFPEISENIETSNDKVWVRENERQRNEGKYSH